MSVDSNYFDDDIEITRGEGSAVYRTVYDSADDYPLSVFIVHSIRNIDRRSGDETTEILADSIDPDAIDALFEPRAPSDDVTLTFSFGGYVIEIRGDGRISFDATESSDDV
jgi:hypothetical protein